jgi:hypothetical protein
VRRTLAVLACTVSFAVQAQLITGAMLMPNPLGVALSLGQWIIFEGDKTYYIEVQGQGRDVSEARNNGFRIAAEQAVGTIIASETEVNNNRITRDEIISYASAHVTKYEIVKQEPADIGVKTTMKVWLKRSTIANRLLNESKQAGTVEGASAAVSVQSFNQERQTGDQLIAAVLRDYPRRAFDIQIGKTKVEHDSNRQTVLIVPYTIRLNQDYIKSLWDTLKATQNKNGCASRITVDTPGFFNGGGTAYYDDQHKWPLIVNKLVYSNPQLEMRLLSESGEVLYLDTFKIRTLTPDPIQYHNPAIFTLGHRGNSCAYNGLLINGARWTGDNLIILNPNLRVLNQATRVEIRVI